MLDFEIGLIAGDGFLLVLTVGAGAIVPAYEHGSDLLCGGGL
jgi:hypothetical protein